MRGDRVQQQIEGEKFVRSFARRLSCRTHQVDALASTREDYEQDLRIRAWLASQRAPERLTAEEREKWVCVSVRRQAASLARARAHRSQPLDGPCALADVSSVGEHQLDARVRLARLRRRLSVSEWALLLDRAGDQDCTDACLASVRNRGRGMAGRPEVPAVPSRVGPRKVLRAARMCLRAVRVTYRRAWRLVRPLFQRLGWVGRHAVELLVPQVPVPVDGQSIEVGPGGRCSAGAGPPGGSP